MEGSLIFIFSILLFINSGLIFLMCKYKNINIEIFRVALIALILIDIMSFLAFLHIFLNILANR